MFLHDNLSSGNGYKVRLLLAQLGLAFERIEYDIDSGETRTPEFLARINANGRVPVLRWMFFEQYGHEPNIATPRFWLTHHTEMTEERRVAQNGKRELGYAALGVMERHLEDHPYFVGERFSVADIALYAYTHVAGEGGFDLSGYPAIHVWLQRVGGPAGTRSHNPRSVR